MRCDVKYHNLFIVNIDRLQQNFGGATFPAGINTYTIIFVQRFVALSMVALIFSFLSCA